jgi:hypothetical protein
MRYLRSWALSIHALVVESLVGTVFLAAAASDFKSSFWVVVAALTAQGMFDLGHGPESGR